MGMSSFSAIFGGGGGAGVPVGGYVPGNPALPDIVVDGLISYAKTGVQVLSAAYPLAPFVTVTTATKWITGNPLPAALSPFVGYQYVSIANGAYRVVFPQLAQNTYDVGQFYVSSDGGATLALVANPAGTNGNTTIRDVCAGGGYFYMLTNNISTNIAQVWRSDTGSAGSWVAIWSISVVSGLLAMGIAFGSGKLFISCANSGNVTIYGSLNPTATTPTVSLYTPGGGMNSPSAVTSFPKIRFGKPGGSADSDKFFILGAGTFYVATATPRQVQLGYAPPALLITQT
jgi:hypothetical protein